MTIYQLIMSIFISSCLAQNAKPLFDVEGKVAIITGGVGGIGAWYARKLLQNKLKVAVLLDKNCSNARTVIKELEDEFGRGRVEFINLDVTNSAALEEEFENTGRTHKQLDIIINNAGIEAEDKGKLVADTNFGAVVVGTSLAFKILPKYKKNDDEGLIVNTASTAGLVPTAWAPIYSGTKAGVVAMGRALGHDHYYQPNKIKILTLCPGQTDTPLVHHYLINMTDFVRETEGDNFARLQKPEVVGDALIKMVHEGRTGSVWVVDNSQPARQINFTDVDQNLDKQILNIQ